MPDHSAAAALLWRPTFDDGDWHRLDELQSFEELLLVTRQSNKSYSDAVRIDTSRQEKLRRDEFIPFLRYAKHLELPGRTFFRKPRKEKGIDIEYAVEGTTGRLQVTTAYPVWFDRTGRPLNGGYQQRLRMEKLTAKGMLMGSGPFERRAGEIVNHEGCNTWEEIEKSTRLGLVAAFSLKARHGSKDVSLLVGAVDYHKTILDAERFHAIVDAAAQTVLPSNFAEVIVVDDGEGFFSSRLPAPSTYQ